MPQIGQILRDARMSAGVASVSDFLVLLKERGEKLARTVVYDTESGRRPPSEATIRAYASALGRPDLLAAIPDEEWSPTLESKKESTWKIADLLAGLNHSDSWLSNDEIHELDLMAKSYQPESGLRIAKSRDEICGLVRSLVARAVCLALDRKIAPGSELYLYQEGPEGGEFPGDIAAPEWGPVLTAALKVGLDLVHIRSASDRSADGHAFSRDLRGLLGYRGRYLPHVLPDRCTTAAPRAILSMPTVGTVEFLGVDDRRRCDFATYFPWDADDATTAAETALWRHVQLCADSADLVVRRFDALGPWRRTDVPSGSESADDAADYWWARARAERILLELEREEGLRFLFKDGLSTATCPPDVAQARMRRAQLAEVSDRSLRPPISSALADEYLSVRGDRHQAFLTGLQGFEAYDFVTLSSLESYCRTGLFSERIDDYWGERARATEVADHLRSVARLLQTFPSYNLIVLSEGEASSLVSSSTSLSGAGWMLKSHRGSAERAIFEMVREVSEESRASFVHTVCEVRHRAATRSILDEFLWLRSRLGKQVDRGDTIAMLESLATRALKGSSQHPRSRAS